MTRSERTGSSEEATTQQRNKVNGKEGTQEHGTIPPPHLLQLRPQLQWQKETEQAGEGAAIAQELN
jgi:hypothetical protein